MDNFIQHELIVREYRRERMQEAKEYNEHIKPLRKDLMVQVYSQLSKIGAWLEGTGAQIHNYFDCLVHDKIAS